MISRRDKLLIHPWEQRRYEHHREKVKSAKAAIDRTPPVFYPHIVQKAKKQQTEKERTLYVENENVRLLQRLADIMRTKRMPDFWREPRPNFLSREKLFEVRPRTTHMNWTPLEGLKEAVHKSAKATRTNRCPTCKGQPERPKIIIPEERVPWQPPRSSFNIKTLQQPRY
ncbi:uncharacterized protein CFAP97D1 [Lucilia sericata]|uniref:uncharacterized protein CFAP97D1 n=1 Tax=Lucilia sericata TaxID=13632 RepID=UPI0018A83182|nr:uncharacterized protein CFAP97D1 [Lucilia sericata]